MTLIRTLIRNWKVSVPAASALLLAGAWLAFGYFGVHTAFIDNKVDDAAPVFDAAPAMVVDADAPAANEVVTEYAGDFSGQGRYTVTGEALVLGNGTEERFLRFENFESNNGPDLNVYLVNPDDPSDFIDLGDLRGNIGDQNYEIPSDVDLDRYRQVAIWCVRFSVGFGTADLIPTNA